MDIPADTSAVPTDSAALSTIAVVGLGTMGSGIAEVLARAGREVIGIDISDAAAARAVAALEASTARSVARGRIGEEERRTVLGRFRTFSAPHAVAAGCPDRKTGRGFREYAKR